MAHPILTDAVTRFLDDLGTFEARATEMEYTDTDLLWELLDRTKENFRRTLEAIAAVRDEAARLRAADVETIRTCFGMTSAEGRELSAQLVVSLGEGAFTDDALCKLSALHCDRAAKAPRDRIEIEPPANDDSPA